jgi:hypothetical protein
MSLSMMAACGGGNASPPDGGDPGAVDVTFDVSSSADVHPISPLIYGWNGADAIADDGQTLVRAGGNRWTAYNWETNASNAGADYMYQNDNYLSTSAVPGDALRSTLDPAQSHGAAALVTVPVVDYVAGDESPGGDVRNSGTDYLMTRFKQNQPAKGSALSLAPDASDDFVYQDEFVNWVRATYGATRVIFSLDNEPDLWSTTHPEVHPAAVRYDELVTRNTDYAAAVKAAWPSAEVAGFVSYGWSGYETLQSAPDASGNGEFLTYYLDKMQAAGATAGQRLVDYLDLHWYPEVYANAGKDRIVGNDTSADSVARRIQAPRSLWDPTYDEGSWISQYGTRGPIALIPLLKGKIAAHYPGTKLSLSEYTYGGGTDISGGIAEADALGAFGREGLDMASAWAWSDNDFQLAAMRLYRNYDGAGAAFGDTSIHAVTSDAAGSSVYASVDSADPRHLFVVAINKQSAPKVAGVALTHTVTFRTAKVYTLTGGGGAAVTAAPSINATGANAFHYTMPPMSVSLLVLQP